MNGQIKQPTLSCAMSTGPLSVAVLTWCGLAPRCSSSLAASRLSSRVAAMSAVTPSRDSCSMSAPLSYGKAEVARKRSGIVCGMWGSARASVDIHGWMCHMVYGNSADEATTGRASGHGVRLITEACFELDTVHTVQACTVSCQT